MWQISLHPVSQSFTFYNSTPVKRKPSCSCPVPDPGISSLIATRKGGSEGKPFASHDFFTYVGSDTGSGSQGPVRIEETPAGITPVLHGSGESEICGGLVSGGRAASGPSGGWRAPRSGGSRRGVLARHVGRVRVGAGRRQIGKGSDASGSRPLFSRSFTSSSRRTRP